MTIGHRVALAAMVILPAACGRAQWAQSMLDTRGPAAARLADLWWLMFWVTIVGAAATIAFLLYAVFGRRREELQRSVEGKDRRIVIAAGAIFPAVVILGFAAATFRVGGEVARPPSEPVLTIEVVGHQFWWEVRYPEHGIVTANELHVPTGQPVTVRVTSADVIHSFWVPNLAGKLDMLPGKWHEMWLQADEPGTYRGPCAEFCGLQHALMALEVFALPQAEFEAWLERERRPHAPPEDPLLARGWEVYREAQCDQCHAIRGLAQPTQTGDVGPDLTHLASRRMLAAATFENNRGNLAGWLLDPQLLKPGARMPKSILEPEALHALVAFLESLE